MTHLSYDNEYAVVWCQIEDKRAVPAMDTDVTVKQLHKVDCSDCLLALTRAGKKAEEYWYALP